VNDILYCDLFACAVLVEEWIGGDVPLENTFIYGIR
jgi:hypothetical protein